MSRVSGSACDPQRQPEVMRVYGQEWWMQIVMHANHRTHLSICHSKPLFPDACRCTAVGTSVDNASVPTNAIAS
jgi:hypothetical protein